MLQEKKMQLDSGVDMTYYEFGEENQEVMLVGQFYYYTFEELYRAVAKKYHVYCLVMRLSGPVTEKEEDGSVSWIKQWAKEFIEFADKIGVDKFTYCGKCHGSFPGWELVDHYPERLKAFIPLGVTPWSREHPMPDEFIETIAFQKTDMREFVRRTVRKPENIQRKMDEVETIASTGFFKNGVEGNQVPLLEYKTDAELFDFYKTITIPVLLIYGVDDVGLEIDMVLGLMKNCKNMKVVFYSNERHLFEMDCPERVAEDILFWVDQQERGW